MTGKGLKSKVVLVTGANNPLGIGAATAKAFAREGASVFVTYLRVPPERKDTPISEVKKATEPGWARYNALRMKSAEEVLVNNACSASDTDTIEDLTPKIIDQTYSVNTRAPLLLIAEYVRRYKKNTREWGRIINLSTGPAQHFTTQVTYGSSKAAIEAFTRAAAATLGPLGITVNTIAPGPTQTGYIDEELEERLVPTIPMRRLGQAEDIANAILFLCSDQAGWITGQVLRVTGGRDMW